MKNFIPFTSSFPLCSPPFFPISPQKPLLYIPIKHHTIPPYNSTHINLSSKKFIILIPHPIPTTLHFPNKQYQ